ncbi:MAG: hypothetical protein ABIP29_04710, partial [Candidatus Eisenbacteria bacterium]
MSFRSGRPLAPQIAFVVCSLVAVALALKVELHWRLDQAARTDEHLAHARHAAERVAEAVSGGALSPAAQRLLRTPEPDDPGEVEHIHLVDRHGAVTWSTVPGSAGRVLPVPPMHDLDPGAGMWVRHARTEGAWAGTIDGGKRLVAVAPIHAEPTRAWARASAERPRVVYVTWDIAAHVAARDARHVRYHASGFLFALLLGIALWLALRHVVSGPLEDLSRIVGRPDMIADDLAAYVGRQDEIGALARALAGARSDLDIVRRQAAERAAR